MEYNSNMCETKVGKQTKLRGDEVMTSQVLLEYKLLELHLQLHLELPPWSQSEVLHLLICPPI